MRTNNYKLAEFLKKLEYSGISILLFTLISYFAILLAHLELVAQGISIFKLNLFAIGVTLVTCLSLYLFLVMVRFISNPNTKAILKLGFVTFIGGLRGVAIYYLGIGLELDSGVDLYYRIWNSMVTTLVWICLFSYIVNNQREFQRHYRKLISQSLLNQSTKIDEHELKKYLDQIEISLKNIKLTNSESNRLAEAASEVKNQVDEIIRPFSRRLWLDSINQYPKIRFFRVLIDAISYLNFSIFAVVVFYLATTVVNLAAVIPPIEAMTRSLANLSLGLLIYLLTSRLKFANPNLNFSLSIGKLALIAVIPNWASDAIHSENIFESINLITLLALLPLPALIVVFSIITLIDRDRIKLIESLSKDVAATHIEYDKSQVASYLHNSLQSELLAISKKLEAAAISDDTEHQRVLLEQLAALLNRSISEDFINFYHNPIDRLDQVIINWSGLLEIIITNKEAIFIDSSKSIIAIQIIEELASNSIKHSSVTELRINCYLTDSLLVLETSAPLISPENSTGFGSGLINTYLAEQNKSNLNSENRSLRIAI